MAEGVTTRVETGLGSRDGKLEIFGNFFPAMTLRSLMKSLGHENRTINVLKVDIEGGEYAALVHETLFGGCKHRNGSMPVEVEQLQLELHGIDARPVARLFAAVCTRAGCKSSTASRITGGATGTAASSSALSGRRTRSAPSG